MTLEEQWRSLCEGKWKEIPKPIEGKWVHCSQIHDGAECSLDGVNYGTMHTVIVKGHIRRQLVCQREILCDLFAPGYRHAMVFVRNS